MVAFGDVDQLKIYRESAHDSTEILRAHPLYALPQPLVEFGVEIEAEPLAQKPDLLLRTEQALALLFNDYLPQNAPEQVNVPPQGLVFRLEAHPGRQIGEVRRGIFYVLPNHTP
jgi:hypothetical protein